MTRQLSTPSILAAQTAAGMALGVAPGSRPISSAQIEANEPPRTLPLQKVIVPANSVYPIVVRGDFVYIEAITYNTAQAQDVGVVGAFPTLKPDTGQAIVELSQNFREIAFPVPFNTLQISNPSNVVVTLTLWIGFGAVRTDTGRVVKTARAFDSVTAGAFAANQMLTAGGLLFQSLCSPKNQRAVIKKAICTVVGSGVTTNADFSLWLFPTKLTAAASRSAFDIYASFGADFAANPPSVIRFPTFVGTGGSGSICVLDGLNIEVFGSDASDIAAGTYPFSQYAYSVANAAWTPGGAGASVSFVLVAEQG